MRRALFSLVLIACWPAIGSAATLRYLLVVGNNQGVDENGQAEVPLHHAESEARELRDRLVQLSNFDAAKPRTFLLLGATRSQVRDAAHRIAEQKEADLRDLPHASTLFAMFFTGHGLHGRLLLNDGPLSGEELGELYDLIDADFHIGMFDACYSGSLEPDLGHKGMVPTPGLNLFRELPDEVLTAEGSVWFVSSSPDQASYEDGELGGLLTHYFTEGLSRAEREGPGITLERIWSYARAKTVDHAAVRGRRQTPQRTAHSKSSGPLYFSFPGARGATLVLAEPVSGRFVLSYADGQLTEVIDKQPGSRRELAVFSGSAWLSQVHQSEVVMQERVELRDGTTLVLHENLEAGEPVGVGRSASRLWEKGVGERTLRATRIEPSSTLRLGLSYQLAPHGDAVLASRHRISAVGRLDIGSWVLRLGLGYGLDSRSFSTWAYDLQGVGLDAAAGWAMRLGPARLGLSACVNAGVHWQRFRDDTQRMAGSFLGAGQLDVLIPLPVAVELMARAGAMRATGAGADADEAWRPWVGFAATFYLAI